VRPITIFLTEEERQRLDATYERLASPPLPAVNRHLEARIRDLRERVARAHAA